MIVTQLVTVALSAASAVQADAQPPAVTPRDRDRGDIVVTGERSKRTLRETPSSVHVISEADIEAQPADRVEQMLAQIPNVQLGSGSEGPAIRGQDTTGALQALPAFLGGNRPRTTLVVDGRPVNYYEFVFGNQPVWDVRRIEVFRSPQTTTQGQNSIAGAIFVNTGDPSFEPEYKARAIVGDFKTRQFSALASGPLAGDSVAFRLAGDIRYSRTTSLIADRAAGVDPNHDVYGTVRAKLLVAPAALPNSRLTLTYAHLQSQAPQVVQVTPPFRERRDTSGFYGTFRINADSLTAQARHEAGDVTATVVLSAGDMVARRFAYQGLGVARIQARDWSGEAVVDWHPPGALELVGGASQRASALNQVIDLSALSGIGRFRDRQGGTGLFGEARLAVLPATMITAGLRYQRDTQVRTGALEAGGGRSIGLDYDHTFDALLPKLSIAHDVSPTVTVGAMVQKAYNPGGTTLRFDTGRPDEFGAERLWDYELFARASLAGGKLTANANIFYYDMRNAQRAIDVRIVAPNGRPVGFADLFNVPKARSSGAEVEAQWRPSQAFNARAAIGLLRTRVVDAGADYPGAQGKSFDRAPHFSASLAVDWRPVKRLQLSAQVRHHSPYWSNALHDPASRVGSGTIADARADYRFSRFALFAYARNVFNTFSFTSRSAYAATLEDPRELGAGIETRF